jgi:hypothetical protein
MCLFGAFYGRIKYILEGHPGVDPRLQIPVLSG